MTDSEKQVNRLSAVRDQTWAKARDGQAVIQAYADDETNDAIGRYCAILILGDLKLGDYLTSVICDPEKDSGV